MFKVLFMLGVVPAQQNSFLWDTVGRLSKQIQSAWKHEHKDEDSALYPLMQSKIVYLSCQQWSLRMTVSVGESSPSPSL